MARTPLTRSAARVSIAVIRALPTVAATGTAKTVRAGSRSAPYIGLPITFSRPSTRCAFAPIPISAMVSGPSLGDHECLYHRIDTERQAKLVLGPRLCILKGQSARVGRRRLDKPLPNEALLSLLRSPRHRSYAPQRNARFTYPIALHRQRHRDG